MHDKVSVFKPCCFCLCSKCDLIAWRCFKMIISAFMLLNFILTLVEIVAVVAALENMYYVDDVVIFAMILGVLSVDFVVHMIFIVGTYKKTLKFFTMYYLYTFCVLILTLLQGFICFGLLFDNRFGYSSTILPLLLIASVSTFIVYVFIQICVLLLVRREIAKLENLKQNRFETKTTVKIEDSKEEKINSTDDNNDEEDKCDINDTHV